MRELRVISLLPAATETMAALGLEGVLVGVSHECILPGGVSPVPRVTRSELLEVTGSSGEIDEQVRAAVALGQPLYTLDAALIRELRPDVLLTQRLCDVCAVEHGSVEELARSLPHPPQVISLEPTSLAGILSDICRLAEALGVPERGTQLTASLEARIEAVRQRVPPAERRPRCVLLEWIDPLFCSGHWNPELVAIAGGQEMIGRAGEISRSIAWTEVMEAAPEMLLVVCCGYTVERTWDDLPILQSWPGWESLPAVRNEQVYVADGTRHFTVPGPSVIDSLELLSRILHPTQGDGSVPEENVNCRRVPARQQ